MERNPLTFFEKDFSFTDPEILVYLKSEYAPISYMGSATSHFQAEPLMYNEDGSVIPPKSDWEFELFKNLEGQKTGIKEMQDPKEFPRFLHKKGMYLLRSKELGENMFRFSLDFGRLCPEPGQFNDALMAEYIETLVRIRSSGQEPLLTLNHFTMPKFLTKIDSRGNIVKSAWEHPDILKHFTFYIENILRHLGGDNKILVKYFMTINEPSMLLFMGYFIGAIPPYRKVAFGSIIKVLRTMIRVHDMLYVRIKEYNGQCQVGIGHSWQYFDGIFGSSSHKIINHYITGKFERDGSHTDFIGVHYYFRKTLSFFGSIWKGRDYSDQSLFGDIYPSGIKSILEKMHNDFPTKQIIVSEIGFADAADKRKPFWLLETIRYIFEAKKNGVPIRGILLWSLVDNFEWELGMNISKFGLFSEKELNEPLPEKKEGEIRSFEVWKAIIKAVEDPSVQSLSALQDCYEMAKTQYDSTRSITEYL